MSSANSSERLDQRLAWARKQLELETDASLTEVRKRFFAALERESFVPDEALDQAFRTLRWEAEGIVDVDDPPEFLKAEEDQATAEVEQFAAQMFSLPPAERRARWAELRRRVDPLLPPRLRLDWLAAGLGADLRQVDGPARAMYVKTLARYAMELFPLAPLPRAVRRREILRSLAGAESKAWRKAAQILKKRHPQVAALAPEFVDQLLAWGKPPRRRAQPPVQVARRESSSWGSGAALAAAACIFLSLVVRGLLHSTPERPPSTTTPQSSSVRKPATTPDAEEVLELILKTRPEYREKLRKEQKARMREAEERIRNIAQPPTPPRPSPPTPPSGPVEPPGNFGPTPPAVPAPPSPSSP